LNDLGNLTSKKKPESASKTIATHSQKKGGVLLLMLEAVITGLVFTIGLKRNIQNRQL
jgi:hypothetical protein